MPIVAWRWEWNGQTLDASHLLSGGAIAQVHPGEVSGCSTFPIDPWATLADGTVGHLQKQIKIACGWPSRDWAARNLNVFKTIGKALRGALQSSRSSATTVP